MFKLFHGGLESHTISMIAEYLLSFRSKVRGGGGGGDNYYVRPLGMLTTVTGQTVSVWTFLPFGSPLSETRLATHREDKNDP
jgi:hypothetical protein